MTNKDSIQQKHLEAIKENHKHTGRTNVMLKESAATSCTTVTADAIGEAMEWIIKNKWHYMGNNTWSDFNSDKKITNSELVQLFLNQKAKI